MKTLKEIRWYLFATVLVTVLLDLFTLTLPGDKEWSAGWALLMIVLIWAGIVSVSTKK